MMNPMDFFYPLSTNKEISIQIYVSSEVRLQEVLVSGYQQVVVDS